MANPIIITKASDIPASMQSDPIIFDAAVLKILSNGDGKKRPIAVSVILENKDKFQFVTWEYQLLETFREGQANVKLYHFLGEAGHFGRELNSIRVSSAKATDAESKAKKVPFSEEIKSIRDIVAGVIKNNVTNQNYLRILRLLLTDNFYIWQAATSNHHDFKSGLAVHSYTLCQDALNIADQYSDELPLDRSLLVTAGMLHDIGKLREYDSVGNFTIDGNLMGHITMGVLMIQQACIKLEIDPDSLEIRKLTHCVLAHHGALEFGSPVTPRTPEAYILSISDKLDSEMTAISEIYPTLSDNETSGPMASLNNGRVLKLPESPAPVVEKAAEKKEK